MLFKSLCLEGLFLLSLTALAQASCKNRDAGAVLDFILHNSAENDLDSIIDEAYRRLTIDKRYYSDVEVSTAIDKLVTLRTIRESSTCDMYDVAMLRKVESLLSRSGLYKINTLVARVFKDHQKRCMKSMLDTLDDSDRKLPQKHQYVIFELGHVLDQGLAEGAVVAGYEDLYKTIAELITSKDSQAVSLITAKTERSERLQAVTAIYEKDIYFFLHTKLVLLLDYMADACKVYQSMTGHVYELAKALNEDFKNGADDIMILRNFLLRSDACMKILATPNEIIAALEKRFENNW